jgi:hypothetical protein
MREKQLKAYETTVADEKLVGMSDDIFSFRR